MAEKLVIPDILADRYASPEMIEIWSPENKVKAERRYWIAVMRAQAQLGLDIPEDVIAAYESVVDQVDFDSMREREKRNGHDVTARLDEFNALAGHQSAHRAMTSRDLTESIEAVQIRDSLLLVRDKLVSTAALMAYHAVANDDLAMVGRSHNVPAQLTTLGKRFANFGEETVMGIETLEQVIGSYPVRGIKGPVGSQQDMLDEFEGDASKVAELERIVASELGFDNVLNSVGQIYPRSLDSRVVHALFEATSGPTNLALNLRLMAGHDLVTEGFKEGQVGSSRMPHKMNAAKSERIGGLHAVLYGYTGMVDMLAGSQWNEGDVSCSVVRRVALQSSFLATDGLTETTLGVLRGFGSFPDVIANEITKYAPFVSSTKVLVALEKSGVPERDAHELIKEHAVALALDMRKGDNSRSLYERLAADERVTMTAAELEEVANRPLELVGLAPQQARAFGDRVDALVAKYPKAAEYQGQSVL